MQTGTALMVSFLLGSIPTAYIVVRIQQQRDIRRLGSGNVGSMNVRDQFGYGPALLVLLVDAIKGAAAVGLGRFGGVDPALCLAAAVAGHIYPPWLRFQGGKGLATALGGVLALWQWPVLLSFGAVWLPAYLLVTGKDGDRSNLAGGLGIIAWGLGSGLQWGIMLMGFCIAFKHFQAIRRATALAAADNPQ